MKLGVGGIVNPEFKDLLMVGLLVQEGKRSEVDAVVSSECIGVECLTEGVDMLSDGESGIVDDHDFLVVVDWEWVTV